MNQETLNEEVVKQARLRLAREDLLGFSTYVDPDYETPVHIQVLASHLMGVERGDIKRLIITMPPRHGKSELTSNKFFAWCLGRDNNRTCISTSHAADLAKRSSRATRDTIKLNPRYKEVFPDTVLDPNQQSLHQWCLINQAETFKAAGVGGGITGFGAWLLLIDDPVKDKKQSASKAQLQHIFDWYKAVSRTRLAPNGRIVLIMTRWHEADLVGRILDSPEAGEYTVLHLPAESYGLPEDYGYGQVAPEDYEKATKFLPKTCFPDPLNRPKGEPLWPEWWDKSYLAENRSIMEHDYQCQYQGHPEAPSGNKFQRQWFRPITDETLALLRKTVVAKATSWDLAWSSRQQADRTAGVQATLYSLDLREDAYRDKPEALALIEDLNLPPLMLVLEDLKAWRKEWPETSEGIVEHTIKCGTDYKLLVEAVASQSTGFKSLRRDKRLVRYSVAPVNPTTDKEIRSKAAIRFSNLGIVFIRYPNATTPPVWEEDFLDELGKFPSGAHDDRVDAFTQLVEYWGGKIDMLLQKTVKEAGLAWATGLGSVQVKRPAADNPVTAKSARPPALMEADPFNRVMDGRAWV